MKTKLLEKEFEGLGEMRGFKFTQISMSDKAYLYRLDAGDGYVSYEVIMRKSSPICTDWENRIYSETESKEMYPKTHRFGIDGFALRSLDKAEKKFKEISNRIKFTPVTEESYNGTKNK